MSLRQLAYETKPIIVVAAGLYGMSLHSIGPVAKIFGLVLLGCGLAIVYMRARYRGFIR